MSIQAIQPSRRSELMAPLIALALAVTLLVIGAQVSMWRARTTPPVQPAPTVFLPVTSDASGVVTHIPSGCRPKVGC